MSEVVHYASLQGDIEHHEHELLEFRLVLARRDLVQSKCELDVHLLEFPRTIWAWIFILGRNLKRSKNFDSLVWNPFVSSSDLVSNFISPGENISWYILSCPSSPSSFDLLTEDVVDEDEDDEEMDELDDFDGLRFRPFFCPLPFPLPEPFPFPGCPGKSLSSSDSSPSPGSPPSLDFILGFGFPVSRPFDLSSFFPDGTSFWDVSFFLDLPRVIAIAGSRCPVASSSSSSFSFVVC
eukprot:6491635-Amphidinium_carterae.1